VWKSNSNAILKPRKLLNLKAEQNAKNARSAGLCTNLYKNGVGNEGINQTGIAVEDRGEMISAVAVSFLALDGR
jgi:hypothetical protein